jgi:tRNA uridine 5-carboxymethylaminomethyl modification enzyme
MLLLESASIGGVPVSKYLRRPEIQWPDVITFLPELAHLEADVVQQLVHDVKYAGYVARQQTDVDRQRRLAEKRIPENFDFGRIDQLRAEAREKLMRIRPGNLAQASRISGITPSDIALLMVHLDGRGKTTQNPPKSAPVS